MTSIRNISRGVGVGMIGLSLIVSFNVGGCGSNNGGTSSGFVDPGIGPGTEQGPGSRELTRVVYEFGPNGLQVAPGAAFYDITLRDASGSIATATTFDGTFALVSRVTAGQSAQIQVPDSAISKVASTTVDVILPNGSVREHFEKAISLTKDQTTVVNSATASTATLRSLKITTSDQQGAQSIAATNVLQMVTGTNYPLLAIGTYSAGTTSTVSNISGLNYTTSDPTVAVVNNGLLTAATTASAGNKATITTTLDGVQGSLAVNISGIAAGSPTPTPTPTPSPSGSPTPRPSATPTPSPGASPSPGSGVSNVQLIVTNPNIRLQQSTQFGVNATVNGTTVNVSSIQGVQLGVSSTNSQVVLADIAQRLLNGVGVGNSTITATVTVSGAPSLTSNPVTVTVTQ